MRCIRAVLLTGVLLALAACSSVPHKEVNEEQMRRYQAALQAMEQGHDQQALDQLKQFVDDNPGLAGPYANMAKLYQRVGEEAQATSCFEEALKLGPDDAEIYNAAAIHFRRLGRFADAERAYLAAIKRAPHQSNVLLNLAILYDLYLHQPSRAVLFYQRYQSSLANEDPRVALWLADLKRRQAE